jgi:hypothetical protein
MNELLLCLHNGWDKAAHTSACSRHVLHHYMPAARMGIDIDSGGAQDEACGVWQHCDCVGVDLNEMPEHYLCELCRLARADPFWKRVGAPVMFPVKLAPVQPPRSFPDGRRQEEDVVQVADRHFMLSHSQLDPTHRQSANFQLQVTGAAHLIVASEPLDLARQVFLFLQIYQRVQISEHITYVVWWSGMRHDRLQLALFAHLYVYFPQCLGHRWRA